MQIETFAGETTSSKVRTDGGEAASPAIIVTDRTDDESGDGVESDDSKEIIAKNIVGHTVVPRNKVPGVPGNQCTLGRGIPYAVVYMRVQI